MRAVVACGIVTWALLCGGCCSNLKIWEGEPRARALSTVQSLRYFICAEDWGAAAQAFEPGYLAKRSGDPQTPEFWTVDSWVPGRVHPWPLGPGDAIVGERPAPGGSNDVLVELRHEKRYEKDVRPRALVLRVVGTEWLIVDTRNW